MDGIGDDLLARAALALDEHRHVRRSNLANQRFDRLYPRAVANQGLDASPLLKLAAQLPVLAAQPLFLQRLGDGL